MSIRFVGTNFQTYSRDAFLLGIIIDIFLLGVLTSQIYVYYTGFPKDKMSVKLGVVALFGIGAAQTVFGVLDFYNFASGTLLHNTNGAVLSNTSPAADHTWFSVTISSALVAMIIQCLHAHKLHILIQKSRVTILIITLSLGQMACALANLTCHIVPLKSPRTAPRVNLGLSLAWASVSLLCDITISAHLISFLRKGRQDSLKENTRARVNLLIRVLLETGTATFSVVLCYGFVCAFLGDAMVLPGLSMGKIYSNSMLALLNCRLIIVGGRSIHGQRRWQVEELRSKML